MRRGGGYWLKLVLGNLSVTVVMLLVVNLIAAALYDAREILERTFVPVSEKASRTSLTDQGTAHKVFREFSQLETRYVPYVEWSREPFQGEMTTVNAEGDRIHAPTTDSPRAHVRMFGGSTMWGKGVPDDHTIPAYFDRLHPEHAVYNHGESGFVSRQSVARLVNLVNQEAPVDLVVFYDGCNDFYTLCQADTSINGHSRETQIARRVRPPSMVSDTMTGALTEVIVWGWGRSSYATGPGSRCQTEDGYAQRVARTMVNNWKIAKSIAESAGAEFHAILQPLASTGRADVTHLPAVLDSFNERVADYRLIYPAAQELIREDGGDWIHDFSDAFDLDEKIYIDGCHVNERGNEIIARRMDEVFGTEWAKSLRTD